MASFQDTYDLYDNMEYLLNHSANGNIEIVAVTTNMRTRIYSGQRYDDSQIGNYRTGSKHIKRREQRGLQTAYVDYNFSGNLVGKSMKVYYSGQGLVISVDNDKDVKIVEGLNNMKGVGAFMFSQKELEDSFNFILNDILKDLE